MTQADLRNLAPPPVAQVAISVTVKLVVGAVLLLLLSRVWVFGARAGWWVYATWIALQIVIAVSLAVMLSVGAKSAYERALAAQRLAAARFPFWPVVLSVQLLGWVVIGRWLEIGVDF